MEEATRQLLRIRPIAYQYARQAIWTGDIALSRAGSIEGEWISRVTHSPYTHATMLGWGECPTVGDSALRLMIAETRQHYGAREFYASEEIQRWPGYYDVYRVIPAACPKGFWNPLKAWEFVCAAKGAKYSMLANLRIWARNRLGFPLRPIHDSGDPKQPRNCSWLQATALRLAGGPVIRPESCDVVPGDLAAPWALHYVYTLFWSQGQVDTILEKQRAAGVSLYGKPDPYPSFSEPRS